MDDKYNLLARELLAIKKTVKKHGHALSELKEDVEELQDELFLPDEEKEDKDFIDDKNESEDDYDDETDGSDLEEGEILSDEEDRRHVKLEFVKPNRK